jgi:SAM-dependent methyltransferase
LESGGRAIDLRRDASWAALSRLALRVPPVCAPLRPRPAFAGDPMKAATVESYDTVAAQFASVWTEHPPLAAIEKLLALIPARSTILDAGCGPGHHSRYLARRGHDVIGVDLSEEMLGIARRGFIPSRFIRMDIEHLKFTPKLDALWCAAVATHVPRERMPALLRNFRAVLKPRGVLGLNLQIGRPSEVACFGSDQRFFEYYAGQQEIAAMVRQVGFEVLDTDLGETTRNTHAAPLTLRWATLYARPRMHGQRRCQGS